MARTFDGTDDKLTTSLGALGFAFGPGTMAMIIDPTDDTANDFFLCVGVSNTVSYSLLRGTSSVLRLGCNNSFSNSTTTIPAADGWMLIAGTKDTGSVAGRLHIYKYTTNAWTHENGAAIANSSVPATEAKIGTSPTSGTFFAGDIAAAGIWNVVLTDAQVEALAYNLFAWFAIQPKALWLLDQNVTTQKVPDLSGNGSNESALVGTTVATASVPVFSYGVPIQVMAAAPPPAAVDLPPKPLIIDFATPRSYVY